MFEDDVFEEMTQDEIRKLALTIFPRVVVRPNNSGLWVIYTTIKEKK